MSKPDILFQTDFGEWGGASMYGMCKLVSPALSAYELSHTVPTFDVAEASRRLAGVIPHWPAGTVFVSVVDPGVGTPRRACAALTGNGHYILTPDNGTLADVNRLYGVTAVREIDERVNRYPHTPKVSIFHGRDLFAYCAARLAAGVISYEQVGPAYPVSEIITGAPLNGNDRGAGAVNDARVSGLAEELERVFSALTAKPAYAVVLNDFRHDGRTAVLRGCFRRFSPATRVFDVPLRADETARAEALAGEIKPFWPENTLFITAVNGAVREAGRASEKDF